MIQISELIVKPTYTAPRAPFWLFGFGAWPAFLLQVLLDSLLGRHPIPTNLDAIDLTPPQEAGNKTGTETAEFGGLRDRNEFGGEVFQRSNVVILLQYGSIQFGAELAKALTTLSLYSRRGDWRNEPGILK